MPKSGIYVGTLSHRRHEPAPHQFNIPLFMVLIDVDRIPDMMSVSKLTGHNRFAWASFDDRDHFGDPSLTLRQRIEKDAAEHDVELPRGPIYLLTHLRYLGYVFNPVSFFYCYDEAGQLATVLAEVNNTFGETRNYWLGANNAIEGGRIRKYRADKALHVSPFMPMDMEYGFGFSEPGEEITVHMSTTHRDKTTFDAGLHLHFREWTAANVRRVLLEHPWMTLKVILAIHWQALILFLKRVPVFSHPTGRNWKVW